MADAERIYACPLAEFLNGVALCVTDLMHPSRIGAGNVGDLDSNINARRTSNSLLLDGVISLRHPELKALMRAVQDVAWKLTGKPFLPVACRLCGWLSLLLFA